MKVAFVLCLFALQSQSVVPVGASQSGLSDEQIRTVVAGFDRRVAHAFETQRGSPLVRAPKQPPLGPGRGNYVRAYSFSIVEFANRCFVLNEQLDQADAALIENAQYYLDNPATLADRDSFHWHAEMLLRFVEQYGAKGSKAPGRLSAGTEGKIMEVVWQYARQFSKVADADVETSHTWHIRESENHHLQIITTNWHFAKLAKDAAGYRDLRYNDGLTAAQHCAAWTDYLKAYCIERARKGLFIEAGADDYNCVGMKGIYNVFDFSGEPEL